MQVDQGFAEHFDNCQLRAAECMLAALLALGHWGWKALSVYYFAVRVLHKRTRTWSLRGKLLQRLGAAHMILVLQAASHQLHPPKSNLD